MQDVLRVLEPIWKTKTETATRLRGRIESVLSWATASGHRTGDNPARWKGNLDALLPKPGKVATAENQPALALGDVARWFAELRRREGMASRALEFLALTAARSGEVRGAAWSEFDLEAGLWTIPAGRMKAGREHRVPLTAEAIALIEALPRLKHCPLRLFCSPRRYAVRHEFERSDAADAGVRGEAVDWSGPGRRSQGLRDAAWFHRSALWSPSRTARDSKHLPRLGRRAHGV